MLVFQWCRSLLFSFLFQFHVIFSYRATLVYLYYVNLWGTHKNCRLQSWTLYKSADCRWISITILCVSFTNSATVDRLEQVQLCNRRIDQSADNITCLKCAKECLILKYKYIQNPWFLPQKKARNLKSECLRPNLRSGLIVLKPLHWNLKLNTITQNSP